jgi:hypothetical protein
MLWQAKDIVMASHSDANARIEIIALPIDALASRKF